MAELGEGRKQRSQKRLWKEDRAGGCEHGPCLEKSPASHTCDQCCPQGPGPWCRLVPGLASRRHLASGCTWSPCISGPLGQASLRLGNTAHAGKPLMPFFPHSALQYAPHFPLGDPPGLRPSDKHRTDPWELTCPPGSQRPSPTPVTQPGRGVGEDMPCDPGSCRRAGAGVPAPRTPSRPRPPWLSSRGFHNNNIRAIPERAFVGNPLLQAL